MSLHFSRHLLRRVFESSQFGAVYLAAAIYLVIPAVTRLILSALAIRQGELGASALLVMIPIGTLYDIVTCLYLFAPFALYLFLLPRKLFPSRAQREFMTTAFSAFVLLNHNRDIALYDGSKLTELNSRKTSNTYLYDKPGNHQTKTKRDEKRVKNAASIYQSAYTFYLDKLYRWH
jgi:hypothetical protein